MATASTCNATPRGLLAYNASQVSVLQSVLSNLESSMGTLPDILLLVCRGECWREFKFPYTDEIRWSAAEFRRFIEDPRPKGCDTPLKVLDQALRPKPGDAASDGRDESVRKRVAAWEAFQEAIREYPGGVEGNPGNPNPVPNPLGRAGKPERTDRNNGTDSSFGVIATLPASQPETRPKPRVRDYKRESRQGNSSSYNRRRLERGCAGKPARPDLLDRVKAGEISLYEAVIQAGYMPRQMTMPCEPIAASRILLRHFSGDDLLALIREQLNHAGDAVLPLLREAADRLGYDLASRTGPPTSH